MYCINLPPHSILCSSADKGRMEHWSFVYGGLLPWALLSILRGRVGEGALGLSTHPELTALPPENHLGIWG